MCRQIWVRSLQLNKRSLTLLSPGAVCTGLGDSEGYNRLAHAVAQAVHDEVYLSLRWVRMLHCPYGLLSQLLGLNLEKLLPIP